MRKALVPENRFGRYFFYAIGEIVLVVIGILIALSINNWNQNRINKNEENKYLAEIKKEILANNKVLDSYVKTRLPVKIEGLLSAKQYNEGKLDVKDTLNFLNSVSLGGLITAGLANMSRNTYDELLSTGNFQLISKDTIKVKVKYYYWGLAADENSVLIYKSDFTKYTAELRPFNASNPEYISDFDQKEMMSAFKSLEFRRMIDLELSYAYSIMNKMDRLYEEGLEIIELVDNELKNK
jgi:hypothetical protein